MTWNYRIIHGKEQDEDHYQVHEVYYDEAGKITRWTVDPIVPYSDTLNGLRWTLERMREATAKPILRREGDTLVEET